MTMYLYVSCSMSIECSRAHFNNICLYLLHVSTTKFLRTIMYPISSEAFRIKNNSPGKQN